MSVSHSLTPYFTVEDAERFLHFMATVFEARVVKDDRYPDSTVQHARMMLGDDLIMLNQATAEYSANTTRMHLYVDDIPTVYARALAHGAVSLMEPMVRPHGDRMAGFKDPCGNIWWIAQPAE